MDDQKIFIDRYVKPHNKVSRKVEQKDLTRVLREANVLYNLCFCRVGLYGGGLAVHHSQIDDKDPMNFLVTKDKEIIINPEITRHSNYTVLSKEACLSFPNEMPVNVSRWQKIESRYYVVDNDGSLVIVEEKMSGERAKMYQHEFDHSLGVLIFNN